MFFSVDSPALSMNSMSGALGSPVSGSRSCRNRGPSPSRLKAGSKRANRSRRRSGSGVRRSAQSSSSSGESAKYTRPISNSRQAMFKSMRGQSKATMSGSAICHAAMTRREPSRMRTGIHGS